MIKKEVEKILQYVQKPARYVGGELNSVIKDANKVDIRYAFCFPDIYEIGMSHLGMKILYGLVNDREDSWCERVFAPDVDMEEQMRKHNVPLFALESGDYIKDFDMIGFTLMYELCYNNVLNMLDLAGIPLFSKDRTELAPIVCVGGPCACNPEPIADFVDIVFLGDGEESTNAVIDLLKECKKNSASKQEFLLKAKDITGVYVPSFYKDSYNDDGTLKELVPINDAPEKVKKSIVSDMNKCYYPKEFVVPFISIVHDRAVEEIFRGCIRGCRFCQAGFIYRPIREKSVETINAQSKALIESTGYDELSLCSLSTSDHSQVNEMLTSLIDWTVKDKINLSLPSLRVDNFSDELVDKLNKVRKSGLTFAPEAGTQRLRDVINKNVTEEEVIKTCTKAFDNGWTTVKLYFMMGLPTETMEDIEGIANLGMDVIHAFYNNPNRQKGTGLQVNISCSSFIPKPFTPFQWEPEDTMESLKAKQKHLLESIPSKKIKVSYHETPTSLLEGVLARGDRRLSAVLYSAYKKGCKFDSWDEHFKFDAWMEAFEENNLDPYFYTQRRRDFSEVLPWDHLDYGISRKFLERENIKAHENETTPHCRIQCAGCGANKLNGGHCDARG
ncbi:TIGR03960 family B12-binding radical SAM protein [Eubacterium coprostanoligenes]|uniref:TIGR03960 family B12-binding radical SAM protein n=1 Tax=Eubacterium coprostanoligenes TaxID=290054 RepID=UPI0023561A0B|nr:TIGR03960 family B12-binding radical SAM protein [Eubacterium coprostanoligenes]MCI6254455.1 TIGR03960 family B12-binding radical SAM protein [Eubacterium coprostanoligenes]MDY5400608.1 TIGR03960 family B12-binding radical SAM protein [Eubacterium coprostanoligenes]